MGVGEAAVEQFPEDLDHVLDGGDEFGEFGGVFVEVFVVEAVEDEFFYGLVDLLRFGELAGAGVGYAAEGDLEGVVVAMALGIAAFTEGVEVLLRVPVGVAEAMRGG